MKHTFSYFLILSVGGVATYFLASETLRITSANLKVEGVVKKIHKEVVYNQTKKKHSTTYTPIFSYRFNESDYLVPSTQTNYPFLGKSTHQVGDQEILYIDPDNNQNFVIDSFEGKWLDSVVSFAFTLLVCLFASVKFKHEEKKEEIKNKKSNTPVSNTPNTVNAEVVAINQHPRITMNNKSCYVIEAIDKKTGLRFTSEPLQDYPFEYRVGTVVPVYVDPMNSKKYSMILSNLRKAA
jgi:hypothetical protein